MGNCIRLACRCHCILLLRVARHFLGNGGKLQGRVRQNWHTGQGLAHSRFGHTYPSDKMHRWLGFVQGVLAARGAIRVDEERNYTRPIFQELYGEKVKTFESSK